MSNYAPAPLSPQTEKTGGMLVHAGVAVAMALSAGTAGFIAALVVWIVYKDRGPLLRHSAAQALNIQLNALIWFIVSVILMFVLVGFILYPLVAVAAIVLHVVGALKANEGVFWNAPFCIKFFS